MKELLIPKVNHYETEKYTTGLIGLQGRLLLQGDCLDPKKKDLPTIAKEALGKPFGRNQHFFEVMERASTGERVEYWRSNDTPQKERYRVWSEQIKTIFSEEESRTTIDKLSPLWQSLGIDIARFDQKSVDRLYQRYFKRKTSDVSVTFPNGTTTVVSSDIKQFIDDVVTSFRRNENGDTGRIKSVLPEIGWLSYIFGEKSAKIISQLIEAEIWFLTNPDEMINQLNQTVVVDDRKESRLNRLNSREKKLLTFLHQFRTKREDQSHFEKHVSEPRNGYFWYFQRAREGNLFPLSQEAAHFVTPEVVAKNLKKYSPGEFGAINETSLAAQIAAEQRELAGKVDVEAVVQALRDSVGSYSAFLKHHYKVNNFMPVEQIPVRVISGLTARLYNPSGRGLAFVAVGAPNIFVDISSLERIARQRLHRDLNFISKSELNRLVRQLLLEIHPHEYTHIIGEQAFWYRVKKTALATANLKGTEVLPARMGLQFFKPRGVDPDTGLALYSERGRGLMEAVTVRLTQEWAKNMGTMLDIETYPGEREVLDVLIGLVAEKNGGDRRIAFEKFVRGYFDQHGPLHLVREFRDRPHFLSAVYFLMEREAKNQQGIDRPYRYPLTIDFIKNTLTSKEQQDITEFIDRSDQKTLPMGTRSVLETKLQLPKKQNFAEDFTEDNSLLKAA